MERIKMNAKDKIEKGITENILRLEKRGGQLERELPWNEYIMNINSELGYCDKAYRYLHTITNLHSGKRYFIFRETEDNWYL
jgi:hypothetical protein